MPTRRRTSSRSRLNQAVRAGRKALRSAEKRIPPDLRRQIERGIKDGQKRFDTAVKDIRARVDKATAPGEIDRAVKRFRTQVEGLARMVTTRTTAATRATSKRRATTRRATTTRKAPSARKPAARKPAARTTRTRRKAAPPPAMVTPMPPAVPGAPITPMGGES